MTTVVQLSSEQLHLPYFVVQPKSTIGKFGSIFSSNEWLEISKEFGNNFVVQSDDMNRIRMFLTIQFAEVMLENPNCTLEGNGNHLFMYQHNSIIDLVDLDHIVRSCYEIVDNILYFEGE